MSNELLSVNIKIPFLNKRAAQIAYDVLRVDVEPKNSIQKEVTYNDNDLYVTFYGSSSKQIRVAVNSLFENISLIADTLNCFNDDMSESYSFF